MSGQGPKYKTGLRGFNILLILSIICLVLVFLLPWVTVKKDYRDEKRFLCNDCGYTSDSEYDFQTYTTLYECEECAYIDSYYEFRDYGTYYQCENCSYIAEISEFRTYGYYNYECPNCGFTDRPQPYNGGVCPECGSFNVHEAENKYQCQECDSFDIKVTELSGNKSYHFNYDLKLIAGDEDEWGGDELYPDNANSFGMGKLESWLTDTIWLSFWGFLIIIISVSILIGLERFRATKYYFYSYRPLLFIIFGLVLIIPAMLILTSGFKFLGADVMEYHNHQMAEKLNWEINESQMFIGGYFMIIIGLIILITSLAIIFKNQKKLENTPTQSTRAHLIPVLKQKKYLNLILIFVILAIICIPVFPYFGIRYETEKYPDNSGDIWDYEGEYENVTVTEFTVGTQYYLEIASSFGAPKSYSNIEDDLGTITAFFWLSILFIIIGLTGIAIKTMNRWPLLHLSLLVVAAIALLVLAILAVVFHGIMIKDIYEFEDDMNSDSDEDNEVVLMYNYVPLIMSLFWLLSSIVFLSIIKKDSSYVLRIARYNAAYYGFSQNQYPLPPPPDYSGQTQPQAQTQTQVMGQGPGYEPPAYQPYPHDQSQRPERSVPPIEPMLETPPPLPPHPSQYGSNEYKPYQEPNASRMDAVDSKWQYNRRTADESPYRGYGYDSTSNDEYQRLYGSSGGSGYRPSTRCSSCNTPLESTMYGDYCPKCNRYW